jgi:probable HAF family extracellular repeat protein
MKRLAFSVLLCLPLLACAQPRYSIVNLEALGAPENEATYATGVNDFGQVAGSFWTLGQTELHVFSYSDGWNLFVYRDGAGMTYLGPGQGKAINDHGVVAGEANLPYLGRRAFLYQNGQMLLLGDLGGGNQQCLCHQ